MNLELLFGNRWKAMMHSSQTSLISAGVLLAKCADIHMPDFDYSGICICAPAALEAELQRVFFDGFIAYMTSKYGKPDKDNIDNTYEFWPEILLNISKSQANGQKIAVKKQKMFTMGFLPFLFGEQDKVSNKPAVREHQEEQAELTRTCMSEYLKAVVNDAYVSNAFETFYNGIAARSFQAYQPGCFVWKTEKIRNDYRNKAAHVDVMTEQEAANCYQSIIHKPERSDVYVFNAEITGVMLELFDKINGDKLNQILLQRKTAQQKPEASKSKKTSAFTIGQIVDLSQLEVTPRGVLRGTIVGSDVGASLSKKYLDGIGVTASKYTGKTIKVKLTRWDENAQKYNAELENS